MTAIYVLNIKCPSLTLELFYSESHDGRPSKRSMHRAAQRHLLMTGCDGVYVANITNSKTGKVTVKDSESSTFPHDRIGRD